MTDLADYNAVDMARDMLRRHEGLRLKPYRCTAGKLTIGYGRNLDDVGITKPIAEDMLREDVDAALADLLSFPWWQGLSDARKAALIDMRFNLGPQGFRGFRRMMAALEAGDYEHAADEILDSRYSIQVGQRAVTIAEMIRTGERAA